MQESVLGNIISSSISFRLGNCMTLSLLVLGHASLSLGIWGSSWRVPEFRRATRKSYSILFLQPEYRSRGRVNLVHIEEGGI